MGEFGKKEFGSLVGITEENNSDGWEDELIVLAELNPTLSSSRTLSRSYPFENHIGEKLIGLGKLDLYSKKICVYRDEYRLDIFNDFLLLASLNTFIKRDKWGPYDRSPFYAKFKNKECFDFFQSEMATGSSEILEYPLMREYLNSCFFHSVVKIKYYKKRLDSKRPYLTYATYYLLSMLDKDPKEIGLGEEISRMGYSNINNLPVILDYYRKKK